MATSKWLSPRAYIEDIVISGERPCLNNPDKRCKWIVRRLGPFLVFCILMSGYDQTTEDVVASALYDIIARRSYASKIYEKIYETLGNIKKYWPGCTPFATEPEGSCALNDLGWNIRYLSLFCLLYAMRDDGTTKKIRGFKIGDANYAGMLVDNALEYANGDKDDFREDYVDYIINVIAMAFANVFILRYADPIINKIVVSNNPVVHDIIDTASIMIHELVNYVIEHNIEHKILDKYLRNSPSSEISFITIKDMFKYILTNEAAKEKAIETIDNDNAKKKSLLSKRRSYRRWRRATTSSATARSATARSAAARSATARSATAREAAALDVVRNLRDEAVRFSGYNVKLAESGKAAKADSPWMVYRFKLGAKRCYIVVYLLHDTGSILKY